MRNLDAPQPSGRLTPLWALIAVLCASPLFFLFALLGDPGKGRAAMLSAAVVIIAIRSLWDLRHYLWFWTTISIIAGLHVPLVLFTRWPQGGYPGFALWLPVVLDFALIYGFLKIVERIMRRTVIGNSPE
jgi:hypothetical protein